MKKLSIFITFIVCLTGCTATKSNSEVVEPVEEVAPVQQIIEVVEPEPVVEEPAPVQEPVQLEPAVKELTPDRKSVV